MEVVDRAEEALGAEPGALRARVGVSAHDSSCNLGVERELVRRDKGESATHVEKRRPVDAREEVLLEVVVEAIGLVLRAEDGRERLRARERQTVSSDRSRKGEARGKAHLLGDAAVLELGEPAGEERRGVSASIQIKYERERALRRTAAERRRGCGDAHELVVARQQRAARVAVVLGRELRAVVQRAQVVDEDGRLARDGGGRLRVGERRRIAEREDVGELGRLGRCGVDGDPPGGVSCVRVGCCQSTSRASEKGKDAG